MPPASCGEALSAPNVPAPAEASVSAAHVAAAVAWSVIGSGCLDAGQRLADLDAGQGRRAHRDRTGGEFEDDGGRVDGGVVVPEFDELRHVEEVAVERTRREVRGGLVGDDDDVAACVDGLRPGAFDDGLDFDGVAAVGELGERDPVARDERDPVFAGRRRGDRRRAGAAAVRDAAVDGARNRGERGSDGGGADREAADGGSGGDGDGATAPDGGWSDASWHG